MDKSQFKEPLPADRRPRRIFLAIAIAIAAGVYLYSTAASQERSELNLEKLEEHHLEVVDESYSKTPEPSVADDCPYGRQNLDFQEVAAATLHRIGSADSGSESFPDFDKHALRYVKAYRNQRDLPAECLTVNWRREYITPLAERVRRRLAELEALASHKEKLRQQALKDS